MKRINNCRSFADLATAGASLCDDIKAKLEQIKRDTFEMYRTHNRGNDHVLRLALNEAEGLAWQTGMPHLFFPTLAMEKVRATVAWQERQLTVRQTASELSLSA